MIHTHEQSDPLSFYSPYLSEEKIVSLNENFNASLTAAESSLQKYAKLDETVEPGFNVFTLTTKKWHYEEYHSEILGQLLSLEEAGKLVYLTSFIRLLKELGGDKLAGLKEAKFGPDTRIEVETEVCPSGRGFEHPLFKKGRVDLLISNIEEKKAIIVENKINDAPDQPRQLPRYKMGVERKWKKGLEKGCEVVAIVYLTLDPNKTPDKKGDGSDLQKWTAKEIKEIDELLIRLPAYQDEKKDLHAWLSECAKIAALNSNNIDVISAFRQYTKLIQLLGKDHKRKLDEKPIIQEFFDSVKDRDYIELRGFKAMIDNLPAARSELVKAHYKTKENRGVFDTVEFFQDRGNENWCFFKFTKAKREEIKIGVRIWMPANWENSHFEVDCYLAKEKFPENWENWEETKKHFEFCEEELKMKWIYEHKKYKKIIRIKPESSGAAVEELYDFVDKKLLAKISEVVEKTSN